MARKKNRIYLSDWLRYKPYITSQPTDLYYLKIANEIKEILVEGNNSYQDCLGLVDDRINALCCFLVSYFEDLISGTDIWYTFTRLHNKLYERPLPYYDLTDYEEKEINLVDINFLIWYYVSLHNENKLYSPSMPIYLDMAVEIFDVLDASWDYAPENTQLAKFYHLTKDDNTFYDVRFKYQALMLGSYLFVEDLDELLIETSKELIKDSKGPHNEAYLNEHKDSFTLDQKTKLLALNGYEWLAEINGSDHPLYEDILGISKKITDVFLYKTQDEYNVHIEHISTGKLFDISKEYLKISHELGPEDEDDAIVYMGIVRFQNTWYHSGLFVKLDFNANLILDYKNSIESKANVKFLDDAQDYSFLHEHREKFLKFNDNKPVAFIDASKINEFIQKFHEYYNDTLALTDEDLEESRSRLRKKGFTKEFEPEFEIDMGEKGEGAVVFYNPEKGLEFNSDISSVFLDPDNPYYQEEMSQRDLLMLIISPNYSPELVRYCLERYPDLFSDSDHLGLFKTEQELDFIMRFYKGGEYHTESGLVFMS